MLIKRVLFLVLVLVVLTFFAPAAPAQANVTASSPRITYVALGDSLGFGLWDFSREGTCTGMGRRWLPTPARRFR